MLNLTKGEGGKRHNCQIVIQLMFVQSTQKDRKGTIIIMKKVFCLLCILCVFFTTSSQASTVASSIFSPENSEIRQYGGNQNDFDYKFEELIVDERIWGEIQSVYPVEDFESREEALYFYSRYLQLIADVGCGYVAVANSIFLFFEGREKDFLDTFGFEMYEVREDGRIDYNYELLILKYFNYCVVCGNIKEYSKEDIINSFYKDFCSYRIELFQKLPEWNRKRGDDFASWTPDQMEEFKTYEIARDEKSLKLQG